MTRKTTSLALILSTGMAFVAGGAMAQSEAMTFSEVDTNGDGLLSDSELNEAFGEERGAEILGYDTDGDGMVNVTEVSSMYEDDPMIGVPMQNSDDPDYRDDETPIDAEESAGDLESPDEMEDND